jgi:glycosyltransferase involved in cell wall biosynthesis
MKIIFIAIKGIPFAGGIEKYTEELGSRLVAKGHEVIVYTMRHYGTKDGYYKGMQIKTIPAIKSRSLEKITATLFASIASCFEENIDIIHFHAFGPAVFGIIPKLCGKKVMVQGHGVEWQRSKWGFIGKLFLKITEPLSIKYAHQITVVSRTLQKYLQQQYYRDAIYIPTGVSQPMKQAPELITKHSLHHKNFILCVARLTPEKGIHHLITAFNKLETDLKLVIAGDSTHEVKYKNTLQELAKNNPKIIFIGSASGKMLQELFSNAYFFVLPSEVEGLATSLLEAMSYGDCCLVSDIPENLEAISDYGITFKCSDAQDLHQKMQFLIANPSAVDQIPQGAKQYISQNYSWDKISDAFENLYRASC